MQNVVLNSDPSQINDKFKIRLRIQPIYNNNTIKLIEKYHLIYCKTKYNLSETLNKTISEIGFEIKLK